MTRAYNDTLKHMDTVAVRKLHKNEHPDKLSEIPEPPKQLYIRGVLPPENTKYLAIVGSREYTSYGKQVCEQLVQGLRGYPISIVSGLALGIDGIAHEAALEATLHTIAIPGSGLDDSVLYPANHRRLARRIVESGGALLSEFDPYWKPRKESFPQRNRIMAGLADAVLVIEATERSGTLITARLALDYNRDVLTVPGSICSSTSKGPHALLKNGAALIETSADILEHLHIEQVAVDHAQSVAHLSKREQELCALLTEARERSELLTHLQCSVSELNTLLASLELRGVIHEQYGKLRLK